MDVSQQPREKLTRYVHEPGQLEGPLGSMDPHGLHERMENGLQVWKDAKADVTWWERKAAVAKLLFGTLE